MRVAPDVERHAGRSHRRGARGEESRASALAQAQAAPGLVLMTKLGVYRHWKGDRYRVLFVGWMSTNGQQRTPQVVYVSLTTGTINVRDEAEFHEQVRRTPPDPTAPCLCDARGQGECREHPGDETMVARVIIDNRGQISASESLFD